MVCDSLSVSLSVGSAESTLFIEIFALSHGSLGLTQLLTTAKDFGVGKGWKKEKLKYESGEKNLTNAVFFKSRVFLGPCKC